jgi:1-acyl-sn-glycerol-3-phosphate acyltransferase/predicted MFS family arabinose efflux permease
VGNEFVMKEISLGKNFWIYFGIMFSSAFVDNVLKNSLIVFALFQGISLWGFSSESLAPLAAGLFILPFLLFSALSGQICDTYDKKHIVIFCKVLELFLGLCVLFLFPHGFFSLLFCCLFLLGLHSTLFGPAKYSMIKDLVPEEKFVLATAWVEAGTFVSILLGTIAGALLASYQVMNNWGVGLVMTIFSAVSMCLALLLPNIKSNVAPKLLLNPWTSSIAMIKQSRSVAKLDTVIKQISWFYFIATFLVTMMPAIVKNDFNLSEQMVSWVYALFIVGVAFGSLFYEKFSKEQINLSPMFFSMWSIFWLLISCAIVLPYSSSVPYLVLCIGLFFLLAVNLGVFSTPLYALLQRLPPKEWQSQAIASNNIVNSLYMVAASLIQILLYHYKFSHAQMFLVMACCWIWVKREMFRSFAYEFMFHAVTFVTSFRYKTRLTGAKLINDGRAVIIVSNHVSFIDWAFLGRLSKEKIIYVMWYYYYRIPILKTLFSASGIIPIAGKGEDKRYYDEAFAKMNDELHRGATLLYFPEGGITKDGAVARFRPGLSDVVQKFGDSLVIYPVYIHGLWDSLFSRNPNKYKGIVSRLLRRHEIVVHLDEPIEVRGSVDLELLRRRILDLESKYH